jgi:fucose 4-O-acetylase-like acetyltransferase
MKERIHWIDTLRGLAILLVVFSHQDAGPSLKVYLFSFHVPLWFFISGYLFPTDAPLDYAAFLRRRWRTLAVPYFWFSILTYPFWFFVGRHYGVDATPDVRWWQPLVGIPYGSGQGHWMLHNVPLWFLPCLLMTDALFAWIHRRGWSATGVIVALVGFSLLGRLDARFVPFPLPWGLDVAFTAIVFYGAGHLVRRRLAADFALDQRRGVELLVVAFVLQMIFISRNGPVNMNSQHMGNYFLFFLAAFAGIAFYFVLARRLGANALLEYCGRNTLVILAAHTIGSSLTKGLVQFVLRIPVATTAGSLGWSVFYAAGSLAFCIPVIWLVNTRFPFLLGRPRDIR